MGKKGKGNIYNIKQHFVFPGNNGVLQFGGTKIERVPLLYAIMSKFYKMNKLGLALLEVFYLGRKSGTVRSVPNYQKYPQKLENKKTVGPGVKRGVHCTVKLSIETID